MRHLRWPGGHEALRSLRRQGTWIQCAVPGPRRFAAWWPACPPPWTGGGYREQQAGLAVVPWSFHRQPAHRFTIDALNETLGHGGKVGDEGAHPGRVEHQLLGTWYSPHDQCGGHQSNWTQTKNLHQFVNYCVDDSTLYCRYFKALASKCRQAKPVSNKRA
jgi:hypothetical protein